MKTAMTAAWLAGLFASTSLFAATPTSASIGISDVAFHVFDLTPDDGVAPGYSVHDVSTGLNTYFYGDGRVIDSMSSAPKAASTLTLDRQDLHASAGWAGVPAELSLTAASGVSGAFSSATVFHSFTVRVAPQTAFAFTALATVVDGRNTPASHGDVGLWLSVRGLVDPQHDIKYELERRSQDLGTGEANPDFSLQRDFSVSYVNVTDTAQDLRFDFRVFSNAGYVVAPVPEPATWSMLGAGLLAIGMRASRRRTAA